MPEKRAPLKARKGGTLDPRASRRYAARKDVTHLFAYGTLLAGRRSAAIARATRRLVTLGVATVRGRLYDLGAYPGLVLDPTAASTVRGTVFVLPDDAELLAALDRYEGFERRHPRRSLFVRTTVPVALEDGRTLECFVYVYNRDPGAAPLLADGRWAPSATARSSSRSPSRPGAPSR
jgi:gamma-glutamylcyclotransferase (GGCT)/AIG2-like uncharacterized protein YtfP